MRPPRITNNRRCGRLASSDRGAMGSGDEAPAAAVVEVDAGPGEPALCLCAGATLAAGAGSSRQYVGAEIMPGCSKGWPCGSMGASVGRGDSPVPGACRSTATVSP